MVDRYSPDMMDDGYGDWVKYEDYVELKSELDGEVKSLQDEVSDMMSTISDLEAEISELEGQVHHLEMSAE